MVIMKNFVLVLLTLSVNFVIGQGINQFDSQGKRHGIWKKNFEKTKVIRYEGEFFHGKEIGLFKFYKKINNQPVLTATKQFQKDNDIADVKFFTSKGKVISEGQMKGKLYIGTWNYYQKDSKNVLTLEHFNDQGVLHGERLTYYKSGLLAEKANYVNGKLEGESTWYSENGKLLKEFIYENGELHGISKYYGAEGELLVEGEYQHDRKHGIWTYYKDGEVIEEKDFTIRTKNPYKKKLTKD